MNMSDSKIQDGFSSALAELERLVEVWGDVRTKKHSVGYLVLERVEALMSPQMSTPYSMNVEALERLASFRKQITRLNIRDKCFKWELETLVIGMIEQRAASQLVRQEIPLLSYHLPWEDFAIEALKDWLMTRNILVTSFGAKGAIFEQIDDVIDDKMNDLVHGRASDNAGIINDLDIEARRLELCEKLEAVPTVAYYMDFILTGPGDEIRSCHAYSVKHNASPVHAVCVALIADIWQVAPNLQKADAWSTCQRGL